MRGFLLKGSEAARHLEELVFELPYGLRLIMNFEILQGTSYGADLTYFDDTRHFKRARLPLLVFLSKLFFQLL